MTIPVRLREEAGRDLAEAATWYEMQRPGLGQEFLDEAARAIRAIGEHPLGYPVMWRRTHRALIHRFPFGVYYRVADNAVLVIAVLHGSRHPRYWKRRP